MKKLINYFTPVTEEHKDVLRHFLAPLVAFLLVGGFIIYWFNH
jgi:hypothetical protein